MPHFPRGSRYSSLEKNVLKHRAFEMILFLHYVEELRSFVVESIRATDGARLPLGTKKLYQNAWKILVEDGVLTSSESGGLQDLIDYRNVIAHATERVTIDVNRGFSIDLRVVPELLGHKPSALEMIRFFSNRIREGMATKYVLSLSPAAVMFEPAEKTYGEELHRLRAKIRRQVAQLKVESDEVNQNISTLPTALVNGSGGPRDFTARGSLSPSGVSRCYALFEAGATPLAVAYLMRISLRALTTRCSRWRAESSN